MKNQSLIWLAALVLLPFAGVTAQTAAPAEKSDPAAKRVLDKIRKKYEGYKTVEAAFALTIELPGQPKEVQKGSVGQDGTKFRLDMDQQTIVSDGKTTWVYLKKNNEVQVNDADPAGSENAFLTPKELLRRYQKGDFLYAITDKTTENGRLLTKVEFKPKDRKSEYSKLRVSIDEKAGTIESILAIAKDGARYTFNITKLAPNKSFAADHFSFDAKKYPGVRVEDLRM
jgi:outer membrane lipoprotein carrier protein